MIQSSFFFYDLETSGFSAQNDRIMQFAGVRTDLNLQIIGEEYNFLIKLADDVLPSPEAILITKITPRQTLDDGYTEAEAVRILQQEIFTPGTIAVGYNNVRFDDEFIRHLFWRNYIDPYEWSYKDGRSRWDLLDVVRMVRAIRPEGINWPVDEDNRATNRLELLSSANQLDHDQAHDALSDVKALIGVAKLIQQHQPKIWQYLFNLRDKKEVAKLVKLDQAQPFVYSSGRLNTVYQKTTVAIAIAETKNQNLLVYDLRLDPLELKHKTVEDIQREQALFREQYPDQRPPLYIKELKLNRCPAVAPLGVMDETAWQRIGLDLMTIKRHLKNLRDNPDIIETLKSMHQGQLQAWEETNVSEVASRPAEARLYDGFVGTDDKLKMSQISHFTKQQLQQFTPEFSDPRLNQLWLGYKARSFENLLTDNERPSWTELRLARLTPQVPAYIAKLQELAQAGSDEFYLEELKLWLDNLLTE